MIRPFDPASDAGAVRALWNRSVRFDPLTPALLEEKVWADPGYTPETVLVYEWGGEIVGFAQGVVRDHGAGQRGYVKLLAVDAAHRRRGIGGELLAVIEASLREGGAGAVRVAESAPNYLTPGLDARYTPGVLFFEKHGYRRIGETSNLEVDLDREDWSTGAEEADLAAGGFTVRRAEAGDGEAVRAFLGIHWPPWVAEVEAALAHDPPTLHLALKEREIIAFAAHDANNVGTGWFGPMGTAPTARGQGLGRVLLRRCLHDQRAQGLRRAVIPWVGPIAFYAHHAGAELVRIFYRYEKNF